MKDKIKRTSQKKAKHKTCPHIWELIEAGALEHKRKCKKCGILHFRVKVDSGVDLDWKGRLEGSTEEVYHHVDGHEDVPLLIWSRWKKCKHRNKKVEKEDKGNILSEMYVKKRIRKLELKMQRAKGNDREKLREQILELKGEVRPADPNDCFW